MPAADLWSYGMIIYQMLTNSLELKEKGWFSSAYSFDHIKIDGDGRDLLSCLLQRDPKKRNWDILITNKWLRSAQMNITSNDSGMCSLSTLCNLQKCSKIQNEWNMAHNQMLSMTTRKGSDEEKL